MLLDASLRMSPSSELAIRHQILANAALAEVALLEGRYHQIKRMFGRFQNRVLALHRFAVGNLLLDPALAPGQSRELTASELQHTQCTVNRDPAVIPAT